jgi:biopolymer transport protein ExbD
MLRRRRTPPEDLQPEAFGMTPMIDVTFQLILFFMLVTDMAKQQLEPLRPPSASKAVTGAADDGELVVNVMPDGKVKIAGRTYGDPALEQLFESRRWRAERGMGYPVVIRADRSAPFEPVQKVMTIASAHGAVTRVHFAALKE